MHHWVFQSRSRMKNPEAAAASQQLARYWRCVVLVQATALGNHSETVFLRQVCFLNWRGLGSGSVSTTDESLMTGKRDRGESIGQSMRDRENLHKILEEKGWVINSRGEWSSEKLSEIEADVEIRRWEQRSSEIALHESCRELETQRLQLLQANIWDNARSERISLCGELEMRNKLFQESRTKDCQEIEELRRRCCEESDRARQAKLDELSMMQQRDPQTVSQLLAQMRESQNKVNSLSDAREFHDPETAGSSGASHVTGPPLTNPSYRTVPRRDSGLPPDTLNMMGISDVFERLPAREGQPQNISKNHGIWHLLLVEWNCNLQNIRWQQDRRGDLSNKTYPIRETFSTVEMEFHVILVELILTVVWWSTRDFQSRSCILRNSLTPWNLKAGKSISRLKFVRRQRILKSRCHGSQKLRKQSQLTNRVHRNQFLGEQISQIVKCWM